MNQQDVFCLLEQIGAIIKGHIVFTSGKHGSIYVNKDAIYPHINETSKLCRAIAKEFVSSDVQVVIAPVIGGIILSQWTAYHLTEITGKKVFSVYAEKTNGGFIIKRGYDKLVAGKNVLVVDDVVTTGGSVKEVVNSVRAINGNVIGLGVLFNRGEITLQDIVNLPNSFALVNMKLDIWSEKECPLCAQSIPINTDVGKGREYLASKLNF
ncbi:MAG: phosphoribosyltransferase family protein [Candidatus Pacebacteria bacterium]|nr:phosphoribosyltransferase family protein [Candidatus Paceibacterota bacterium]